MSLFPFLALFVPTGGHSAVSGSPPRWLGLLALVVVLAVGGVMYWAHRRAAATDGRHQSPTRVFERDGWRLIVSYELPGTRSQRANCALERDDELVEAAYEGQEIETPLGTMRYYDPNAPFGVRGWCFKEEDRLREVTRMQEMP